MPCIVSRLIRYNLKNIYIFMYCIFFSKRSFVSSNDSVLFLVNDNNPGWYICLCLSVWSQLWCMEQWLLERQTHSLQTTPRLRWLLLMSWCSSTESQPLTMPQRTETSRYSFIHALEHQNTQYAQYMIKRFLIVVSLNSRQDLSVLRSLSWNQSFTTSAVLS